MPDEKKRSDFIFSDQESETLEHYGTPRHSGRYPWGSGKNPQRSKDFISRDSELKEKGLTEQEVAKALCGKNATTVQLRAERAIAAAARKQARDYEILRWKDKGLSVAEISRRTGIADSTIRTALKNMEKKKTDSASIVVDALKSQVEQKGYLDVGRGSEESLGVTKTRVDVALEMLKKQGYTVTNVQIPQLGTGNKTTIKVLAKKGATYRDIVDNHLTDIKPITDLYISNNLSTGKEEIEKIKPPVSINGKRVLIRYAEEGGINKDGCIELRPGVGDLSLGKSQYAQVRIGVDDKYYMKGMAVYSGDIPKGYDVVYNTNKKKGTPAEKVYKSMVSNDDPTDRFGALVVRQNKYLDENGKQKQGVLNIVREEGDWSDWSNTLASQFLSKQSVPLAKQQLDLDLKGRKEEFDEIKHLTNPVVKRKMLQSFSDDCDAAAVHLKAAALPRQGYHVLIPLTDIKDNEIYAPNYSDGEKVVLVRYPHGGTFESPELTVNNKRSKFAKSYLKNAPDAIGISSAVAEQMSGADFDGDAAIVIPNRDGRIQTKAPLQGLKGFDSKIYKLSEDHPYYGKVGKKKADGGDGFDTQRQMGVISNLITDMTILGAPEEDLCRAVKHSMVVIDAEKHSLDWKQSKIDNSINDLVKKYQPATDRKPRAGGASTLISKASSPVDVPKRAVKAIDPDTGEYIYRAPKGSTWYDAEGNLHTKTQKSTKMYEAKEATELLSSERTLMERTYASYANTCKALGNTARKELLNTPLPKADPVAKKKYATEVASLKTKLSQARKSAPQERQAQLLGYSNVLSQLAENPSMTKEERKKAEGKAIVRARKTLGTRKYRVTFTDKEWEAVQNNAISSSMLSELLDNADMDKVRDLAMPKNKRGLSSATQARIRAYAKSGYTQVEIAQAMGLTEGQINNVLQDK